MNLSEVEKIHFDQDSRHIKFLKEKSAIYNTMIQDLYILYGNAPDGILSKKTTMLYDSYKEFSGYKNIEYKKLLDKMKYMKKYYKIYMEYILSPYSTSKERDEYFYDKRLICVTKFDEMVRIKSYYNTTRLFRIDSLDDDCIDLILNVLEYQPTSEFHISGYGFRTISYSNNMYTYGDKTFPTLQDVRTSLYKN